MKDKTQMKWEADIAQHLLGKTIAKVEYLSEDEAKELGWHERPLCIKLIDKDNNYIWLLPMQDDEGNDGGAMSTTIKDLPTIPVFHYSPH